VNEKNSKNYKWFGILCDDCCSVISYVFTILGFRKINRNMKVISIVRKPINQHNPKAQSVCIPEKQVEFNKWQEHIRKELAKK
jgi:hypothetical protein